MSVKAIRHLLDQLQDLSAASTLSHRLVIYAPPEEPNVLGDGTGYEDRVLWHKRDGLTQVGWINVCLVDPGNG